MKAARWLILVLVVAGCGSPVERPASLSIEDWQKLPVAERFNAATFERLKTDNPSLQTDEGWEAFERVVLRPARQAAAAAPATEQGEPVK